MLSPRIKRTRLAGEPNPHLGMHPNIRDQSPDFHPEGRDLGQTIDAGEWQKRFADVLPRTSVSNPDAENLLAVPQTPSPTEVATPETSTPSPGSYTLGKEVTENRWPGNRNQQMLDGLKRAAEANSIEVPPERFAGTTRTTTGSQSERALPTTQPDNNPLLNPQQLPLNVPTLGVDVGASGAGPAVTPPPMTDAERLAGDSAANQRFGARPEISIPPDYWQQDAQRLRDVKSARLAGGQPPRKPPSGGSPPENFRQPILPGTELVNADSSLMSQVTQGAREGWGYAHDKGGFARSAIWHRAGPENYEHLPPIARAGFAAGRIAGDVVGEGSKSLLWRIQPEDAVGTKIAEYLAGKGVSKASTATTAKLATTAMGLAAGNIALGNFTEGGRPEGFAAIDPDPEDARKSTNNLSEIANRAVFGRTGRLLPWEEFHQEKPDVSYETYANYQAYLKDQGPLFGTIKGTMDGISGPEVRIAGYRVTPAAALAPLAVLGGAAYLARKGLIK